MKSVLKKLIIQLALILLVLLIVGVVISRLLYPQQGFVAMFCALAASAFSVAVCLIPVGFAIAAIQESRNVGFQRVTYVPVSN